MMRRPAPGSKWQVSRIDRDVRQILLRPSRNPRRWNRTKGTKAVLVAEPPGRPPLPTPADFRPGAGAGEPGGGTPRRPGVRSSALAPNRRGAERALAAGADELEAVVSASRTHNLKNLRRTPEESLEEIAAVV